MGFEAIAGKVGISVYLLCACIAFVFVTVSTPIAQLKGKGFAAATEAGAPVGVSKLECVTFWGLKTDCTQNPYEHGPGGFECPRMSHLFKASEAFAIISIAVTLISCVTAALTMSGSALRGVTIVLGLLGVCTTVIPWACMAGIYHGNFCSDVQSVFRAYYRLSAGFGLFVAAWCLQLVGTVALIAF